MLYTERYAIMSLYSKIIAEEWYENLIKSADKIINKVYEQYAPVYKHIINFIKKNNLQLSNLNLILNKEIEYDSPLQIYATDPLAISNSLFSEICKKFGNDYVLQVELIDRQYTISHIVKTYIRISYVERHEDGSILDFLAPIKINNIKIIPPILELIDLYKQIYNPENAESWAELIQTAEKIKKITDLNIKKTESEISDQEDDSKCIDCIDTVIRELTPLLIECFKKYTDYILVDLPHPDIRMSILSKNTIQTDFERISNFLATSIGNDYTIVFKNKTVFLGKDLRIQKYSLYVSASQVSEFSNTQTVFLDIYNNLSYELVPYQTKDGLNIAHHWAQIRFYYMYIWDIFSLYNLNLVKHKQLVKILAKLKPYINKSIDWHTPPTQFMGIYINEYISFKKTMIKSGKNARIYCGKSIT